MSGARRHPMPCPACRKRIDARDHLCPHCGVDTDAKLAPARSALALAVVVVIAVAAMLTGSGTWRYACALGLLLGLGVTWYASKRSSPSM